MDVDLCTERTAAVDAAIDLAGRTGARRFHMYSGRDPVGHVAWNAVVGWGNGRLAVNGQATPNDAALAIAVAMILRGRCRCGYPSSIVDSDAAWCKWRLVRGTWTPSCPPDETCRDLTVRGAPKRTSHGTTANNGPRPAARGHVRS